MDLRYVIATVHLLTLALGFSSCWMRASALKKIKDESGVNDVIFADNLWGLAALLWIVTGVWRAFFGLEKGSEYYLNSNAFLIKMSLFIVVFALEIRPIIVLMKWRSQKRKGIPIDLSVASSMSRTTYVQLLLLIPIVTMAAAMARGMFY